MKELDAMDTVVGIYMFDGVELLDFAGPYEVFTTASRVATRDGVPVRFRVAALGETPGLYQARAGLELRADYGLVGHPALDLLLVVGGVVEGERRKPQLSAWLQQQAAQVPIVASVCTGTFMLADAGLLHGLRATTHWADQDDLAREFPDTDVVPGVRWIDNGAIATSAGISAGIDMSLHLVARIGGMALAHATARQMDYEWRMTA